VTPHSTRPLPSLTPALHIGIHVASGTSRHRVLARRALGERRRPSHRAGAARVRAARPDLDMLDGVRSFHLPVASTAATRAPRHRKLYGRSPLSRPCGLDPPGRAVHLVPGALDPEALVLRAAVQRGAAGSLRSTCTTSPPAVLVQFEGGARLMSVVAGQRAGIVPVRLRGSHTVHEP